MPKLNNSVNFLLITTSKVQVAMNLSRNAKHSLFAPFSPHFKTASWPTYSSMSCEAVSESAVELRLRRFSGLFWPLFDSNCRGHIRKLILPLQFEVEKRLKRTRKSTEAYFNGRLLKSDKKCIKNQIFSISG